MGLVAYSLTSDVTAHVRDLVHNPVAVDVTLVPGDKVAFPAVIVDLGDAVDPLGYVKQSKDMVTMEDLEEEGK